MTWQLADAKNRFSELVRKALTEGPQVVTRRDEAVVVLAEAEYRRLTGRRASFLDWLTSAPPLDGLDLARDRTPPRDAAL